MAKAISLTGVEIVRDYDEYGKIADGFFHGDYNLLIVVGRPGIGKSETFSRRLGPTSHRIRGFASALQTFIELYRHRNQRIVLDDCESLLKQQAGRMLVRAVTEHQSPKVLQWTSASPALARAGVPTEFETTSTVAIIANELTFCPASEFEALRDRGHIIWFNPPPLSIHYYVAEWFRDREIFDHIGQRLHLINDLSGRLYRKAEELKKAGRGWKQSISACCGATEEVNWIRYIEYHYANQDDEVKANTFVLRSDAPNPKQRYWDLRRELQSQGRSTPPYFPPIVLKSRGADSARPENAKGTSPSAAGADQPVDAGRPTQSPQEDVSPPAAPPVPSEADPLAGARRERDQFVIDDDPEPDEEPDRISRPPAPSEADPLAGARRELNQFEIDDDPEPDEEPDRISRPPAPSEADPPAGARRELNQFEIDDDPEPDEERHRISKPAAPSEANPLAGARRKLNQFDIDDDPEPDEEPDRISRPAAPDRSPDAP